MQDVSKSNVEKFIVILKTTSNSYIKFSEISLTNDIQGLNTEKHKTLLREREKNLNKGSDRPCPWIETGDTVRGTS